MKSLSTLNRLGRSVSSWVFIPTLDVCNCHEHPISTTSATQVIGRALLQEEPYWPGRTIGRELSL